MSCDASVTHFTPELAQQLHAVRGRKGSSEPSETRADDVERCFAVKPQPVLTAGTENELVKGTARFRRQWIPLLSTVC